MGVVFAISVYYEFIMNGLAVQLLSLQNSLKHICIFKLLIFLLIRILLIFPYYLVGFVLMLLFEELETEIYSLLNVCAVTHPVLFCSMLVSKTWW